MKGDAQLLKSARFSNYHPLKNLTMILLKSLKFEAVFYSNLICEAS